MHPSKQRVVGLKISTYRKKAGLTPLQLSKKLENQTTLQQFEKYENGKNITFSVMADIAKALQISPKLLYPESVVMSRDLYGKAAPQEEPKSVHNNSKAMKDKPMNKDITKITDEFAKACFQARWKMGKTLGSVAKELGMSAPTITAVESQARPFTKNTINKLAGYYGLNLADFDNKVGQ